MNIPLPDFLFDLSKNANQKIYLVGGAVRDLLLDEKVFDFDILCETDAIKLAQHYEARNLATIKSTHPDFGTAKIIWADNQKEIDLATARSEYYEYPGALPKVSYPVEIKDDLKRRDFTINAIALEIKSDNATEFVDPLGGRDDLRVGIIRILHEKSYWEDPTRIIRAVRFAKRFDYQISEEDIALINLVTNDRDFESIVERIRGVRFGIELKRLLELENWLNAAGEMKNLFAWNLYQKDLKVSLSPINLNSWEMKLFWLLQDNDFSQVSSIYPQLGMKSEFLKIFELINKLTEELLAPSLKLLKSIYSLPDDAKEVLFSIEPKYRTLYEQMKLAQPNITPKELIQQGYAGADISKELERIFIENMEKSN